MQPYVELNVTLNPKQPWSDVLMAELADLGFDAFMEHTSGFLAYCAAHLYNSSMPESLVQRYSKKVKIVCRETYIEGQNWNAVWESNFESVEIDNTLRIRAEFHPPKEHFTHELIIQPRMAFGTGHHATTRLVCEWLLTEKLKNKRLLDMGCGTGILGILAKRLGASQVISIDNDIQCVENTIENARINNTKLLIAHGDKSLLKNYSGFDVVIANINTNILADMAVNLAQVSKSKGKLIISGFYVSDSERLKIVFENAGFQWLQQRVLNNWTMAELVKN